MKYDKFNKKHSIYKKKPIYFLYSPTPILAFNVMSLLCNGNAFSICMCGTLAY